MFKNLFKKICLMLLVCSGSAQATLKLELTQGMQSLMPIAITPFAGQSIAPMEQRLANVIAHDLAYSGYFNVIKNPKINPNALNPKTLKGMDYVLTGDVSALPNNKLKVSAKLLFTLGGMQTQWSKVYEIEPRALRQLGHHISDEVYKTLTGNQGFFASKIAYILVGNKNRKKSYQLMVADIDGYNPRAVLTSTAPLMSPSWSPNNKNIAYVSFENRRSQIYNLDIYTGKRTRLTAFPGINGAPAWSPDGKQLALVLSKSGTPKIYTLDVSSKRLVQRTFGMAIDTEPTWAPDGNTLLFTSDRGGSPQIYELTLNTKQIKRVTYDGPYNATPQLTPDGKSLVMLHRDPSGFNIAIQNLTNGIVSQLTYAGNAESPTLAPNGKMVMYATKSDRRGILGMVSTNGKVKLRLPPQNGSIQEPAWGY